MDVNVGYGESVAGNGSQEGAAVRPNLLLILLAATPTVTVPATTAPTETAAPIDGLPLNNPVFPFLLFLRYLSSSRDASS